MGIYTFLPQKYIKDNSGKTWRIQKRVVLKMREALPILKNL